MIKPWAVIDSNNIVIRVEIASDEWVSSWQGANPSSEISYIATDVEARDYAGIGWSWDAARERFIAPMPEVDGRWVYDEEEWAWVNLDAPINKPDEGTTDGETAPPE